MNTTVSFVVVNASGREHLEGVLASLKAMDYPEERCDIWIVDNDSKDDSVTWLKENHPSVNVICNTTNEGFARPNNVVAQKSTADWLALVNNDIRLEPNWLTAMLQVAHERRCDCVASRILNWDGKCLDFDGSALAFSGHGLQPRFGYKAEHARPEASYPVPFACGGAMLVRREAFNRVGGFDESYFAYYEDVDLGWRLWLYGYEVWFASQAIAYHRHNATSKKAPSFQKKVLMERNALYSVLKNYSDENLAKVLPAVLLLANKRFLLGSGIDCGDFRFSLSERPAAQPSIWGKTLKTLSQEGTKAVLRKILLKVVAKLYNCLGASAPEGKLLIARDDFAQIVAFGEIADRIEEVMARRQEIQTQRNRPDAEILPLFGEPLLPLEENEDYRIAQQAAIKAWELDRIFP